MSLTLAEAKSTLAAYVDGGKCSPANDTTITQRLNDAIRELLPLGHWKGTIVRYKFCADQGCITLPREIESVFNVSVCDNPLYVRDIFFENHINTEGYGNEGRNLIDRGEVPTLYDICGDKKVKIYTEVTEASDSKVLLKGLDADENLIRSNEGGIWFDGEYVTIPSSPVTSTNTYSKISSIILPSSRRGIISIYSYNAAVGVESLLAKFHPSDPQAPKFRRYLVPWIPESEPTMVSIVGKRRYVPLVRDTDELIISNTQALSYMLMALAERKNKDMAREAQYIGAATQVLQKELENHRGISALSPIQMSIETSPGTIYNLI